MVWRFYRTVRQGSARRAAAGRPTRFVKTTEAGARHLEDARRIIAEVDEADEAAAGINGEPRDRLAVTAPALFGRMFVAPVIVEYLKRYPDVSVSALFLDRVVNLLEEGLDIGIRSGHRQRQGKTVGS